MMSTMNIMKIFFAGLSTLCFLFSALVKYPEPPKKGDLITAAYPQNFTKCIKNLPNIILVVLC